MSLQSFIEAMPKVELHVHLEGATRPETLLKLAARNGVQLPANTVEGLRPWYNFSGFDHFIEVYLTTCEAIRTAQDIELLMYEFLQGQAAQHILYTEVTYTPHIHYDQHGIAFDDQLAALNRARRRAEADFGVRVGIVTDIARQTTLEEGMIVADWAISGMHDGVVAFGLGGPEVGHPPEKFTAAFERVRAAGLPAVPHAGETEGPASIRGALDSLHAVRIGHGVRCLEDPALVDRLREEQIPLEVCPTSNVCLRVVPDFAAHPLPRLLDEGLYITLNSDDPPMFNTTLTREYQQAAAVFGLDLDAVTGLVLNAARASLLPPAEKADLEAHIRSEFTRLRGDHVL